MRNRPRSETPKILLGVTVDQSLKLLHGQPQYLSSRGWSVHIVSAGDSTTSAAFYLGPLGAVKHHTLSMTRDPSPMRDAFSLVRWLRLIGQIRPDVVCLGTPKASLLGLTAARMLGVPARIYLLRGLRLEGEMGLRRHVLCILEKLTASMATQVLVVGESLREVAGDLGIGGTKPLVVVGKGSSNGIEIPRMQESQNLRANRDSVLGSLRLDPQAPVVGFVGRLTPDKGVHILAEACASLVAADVPVQVLLVGAEDSPDYQKRVTDTLNQGSVPYAFTGYVEKPWSFMAAMDIFCLPSLREGMPNVSLEAGALGLPVVTTMATGCRDSLLPGVSGLTFDYNDPCSLSTALGNLLTDESKRRRFGDAGREWVTQNFERKTVWRLYEEFYRGILKC